MVLFSSMEEVKGTSELTAKYFSSIKQRELTVSEYTQANLARKAFESSKSYEFESRSEPMKRLTVKSNFARSKTLILGSDNELVLHFNRDGYATFPEHLLPALEVEMRARPGRYTLVQDEPVAEEVSKVLEATELLDKLKAAVLEEKAKAEADASEDLDTEKEEESEEKVAEPKPEPVKKKSAPTKKKRTTKKKTNKTKKSEDN